MTVFDRAQQDVDDGRPWQARDRLRARLRATPRDQRVIGMLGQVHWDMGDRAAAGRYWFLSDREGDEVEEAINAFRAVHSRSLHALIDDLPYLSPLSEWPVAARRRLQALDKECRARGIYWDLDGEKPSKHAREPEGNLNDVLKFLAWRAAWVLFILGMFSGAPDVWDWLGNYV